MPASERSFDPDRAVFLALDCGGSNKSFDPDTAGFLRSDATSSGAIDDEKDLSGFEHLALTPRETPRGTAPADSGDEGSAPSARAGDGGRDGQQRRSRRELFAELQGPLREFHTLSGVDNTEQVRLLFSDLAGKPVSAQTMKTLLSMPYELGAAASDTQGGDGNAGAVVSFALFSRLFLLGLQEKDLGEAARLRAVLDTHIQRLGGPNP